MTNTSDKTVAGKIDTSETMTPMSDHVAQFWRLLETEHVRILIDIRRDHDEGQPPHWDSSSFGDDVARALCTERDEAVAKVEHLKFCLNERDQFLVNNDQWSAFVDSLPKTPAELSSLRAKGCGWKCKANPYAAVPSDCDWPNCGCDPHVERVIAGLREGDWEILTPKEAHERAKGCGVSDIGEDQLASYLIDKVPVKLSDDDAQLIAREVLALIQSAPQDAKLPAPMEGEREGHCGDLIGDAIVQINKLDLETRRASHMAVPIRDQVVIDVITIAHRALSDALAAARALEALSRRNEGDGRNDGLLLIEFLRLRKAVEDAVDTLESMDLHIDSPLYERLRAALELAP